jgi:hypothetical protein
MVESIMLYGRGVALVSLSCCSGAFVWGVIALRCTRLNICTMTVTSLVGSTLLCGWGVLTSLFCLSTWPEGVKIALNIELRSTITVR